MCLRVCVSLTAQRSALAATTMGLRTYERPIWSNRRWEIIRASSKK